MKDEPATATLEALLDVSARRPWRVEGHEDRDTILSGEHIVIADVWELQTDSEDADALCTSHLIALAPTLAAEVIRLRAEALALQAQLDGAGPLAAAISDMKTRSWDDFKSDMIARMSPEDRAQYEREAPLREKRAANQAEVHHDPYLLDRLRAEVERLREALRVACSNMEHAAVGLASGDTKERARQNLHDARDRARAVLKGGE